MYCLATGGDFWGRERKVIPVLKQGSWVLGQSDPAITTNTWLINKVEKEYYDIETKNQKLSIDIYKAYRGKLIVEN